MDRFISIKDYAKLRGVSRQGACKSVRLAVEKGKSIEGIKNIMRIGVEWVLEIDENYLKKKNNTVSKGS